MKLTGRALPTGRLADDGARPTFAAKRRLSECAWWAWVGALCSLCTESLGGTLTPEAMAENPSLWALRLLLAAPGAVVFWSEYRAYRRRRSDPTMPQDRLTDQLLQATGWGFLLAMVTAALAVIAHNLALPLWLIDGLMYACAAGITVTLAAAIVFGARRGWKRRE
jgi:hypothetical protein